jgi:N-acetylneuraminic acid mutarotase
VAEAWTDVAPVPVLRGRSLGATIGNNVYVFGGRSSGTDFATTVYRYDTAADTWALLPATLPDAFTSNMAGGVLTFPEGQRVFVAGGSGAGSVYTDRTLAFNPADNTFTPKAVWPAAPLRIPSGWAVANNKFYIFGGFDSVTPGVFAEIWEYNPTTNTWTQNAASLGTARAYIATELMPDGMIYLAGGTDQDFFDLDVFEKFNPATNTITSGPNMPVAKSNNQGYNVNGKFYVPMGGVDTQTTDVYIYDPATNSWGMGATTPHFARNYAKGYGAGSTIYAIGVFDDSSGSFLDFNQKLTVTGGGCPSPTVPPVTATPTSCPITFSDVPPNHTFYNEIRCLACRGIISGYSDGTFRPGNDITRGQIAKMVSNAAGFTEPVSGQRYEDVPTTHTFYVFIERLSQRGHMGGYPCGTIPQEPCNPPENRPYFRPQNSATRGQISKIVSNAAGFTEPHTGIFYTDVQEDNPFYVEIMRLTTRGVMSGYPCGTVPSEPCDSENRPYFRWGNNVTRGQASKIVANTFFPGCVTPSRPAVQN